MKELIAFTENYVASKDKNGELKIVYMLIENNKIKYETFGFSSGTYTLLDGEKIKFNDKIIDYSTFENMKKGLY